MYVKIAFLYEDGGRPLPRHRVISLQPSIAGLFTLTEEYSDRHRRTISCAILLDAYNVGQRLVPNLLEARLTWAKDGRLVIKGVEEDELTRKQTAQAWLVEVIGPMPPAGPGPAQRETHPAEA